MTQFARSVLMITAVAAGFALHAPAQQRYRDGDAKYEVTITNLTRGQRFTPVLAVTHRPDVRLFQLGERASDPLRALAEEGDVMPFRNLLTATRGVGDVQMTPAPPPLDRLLGPGKSVKLMIDAPEGTRYLSLAAMLIPTNDGFVALDTVPLPRNGEAVYYAMAYDAGTEMNDEKCASIPGPGYPECGGDGGGARIGNGEGFVHIHSGIHGVGNFMPAMRDWQNPVALIRITRMED